MNATDQEDQRLDALLQNFYKAEMPRSWPNPGAISISTTTSIRRSRTALVAAVVVLWLSHSWLMRSSPQPAGGLESEARGKLEATHRSHESTIPAGAQK